MDQRASPPEAGERGSGRCLDAAGFDSRDYCGHDHCGHELVITGLVAVAVAVRAAHCGARRCNDERPFVSMVLLIGEVSMLTNLQLLASCLVLIRGVAADARAARAAGPPRFIIVLFCFVLCCVVLYCIVLYCSIVATGRAVYWCAPRRRPRQSRRRAGRAVFLARALPPFPFKELKCCCW